MKKIIATLTIGVILLGTIGYGLNILFHENIITYMSVVQRDGITYYKYDVFNYIQTLADTLDTIPDLSLSIPTRQWLYNASITEVAYLIGNDLAVILNWLLFTINIFLYPLRIVFFATKLILTIIGLNMLEQGTSLAWLQILCNVMITLQIPYV